MGRLRKIKEWLSWLLETETLPCGQEEVKKEPGFISFLMGKESADYLGHKEEKKERGKGFLSFLLESETLEPADSDNGIIKEKKDNNLLRLLFEKEALPPMAEAGVSSNKENFLSFLLKSETLTPSDDS